MSVPVRLAVGRAARGVARPIRAPRLRLAPRPAPAVAGNLTFIAVVAALVLTGMAALLVLNTSLAQGAFDLQRLQDQQSRLQVSAQTLAQQVEAEQSPAALQHRAQQLGMVPVTVPVFLRLSDHAVLGDPTPAARPARPARARTASDAAVAASTPMAGTPATPGPAQAAPAGGGAAVAAPEGAEVQAAPAGGDAAVPGPEGAEVQAAPTGTDAAAPAASAPDAAAPGASAPARGGNG